MNVLIVGFGRTGSYLADKLAESGIHRVTVIEKDEACARRPAAKGIKLIWNDGCEPSALEEEEGGSATLPRVERAWETLRPLVLNRFVGPLWARPLRATRPRDLLLVLGGTLLTRPSRQPVELRRDPLPLLPRDGDLALLVVLILLGLVSRRGQ